MLGQHRITTTLLAYNKSCTPPLVTLHSPHHGSLFFGGEGCSKLGFVHGDI